MYYNSDMGQINKTTLDITKALLKQAGSAGVSKVRLAKMIYFTHKELCKKGVLAVTDAGYIRMPLGPVPQGFNQLCQDPDIKIQEEETGNTLSYNKEVYYLRESASLETEVFNGLIPEIFGRLNAMSTSRLVEESHKDDSWQNHKNGDVFTISQKDLANPLPRNLLFGRERKVNDSQQLQSLLLKGMLEDIVEESTRLEYPNYGVNAIQK